MSQAGREGAIRRILVALDASPHSLAALRAAAGLAARLNAELIGIFVEDINLLRLAELPFSREMSRFSTAPRQLDRQEVERQLRVQARQARQALEGVSALGRIRWSFRVAQGVVPVELLLAAEDSDLIVLGKTGWSRRRGLGSTARLVVIQAARPALVLQVGARIKTPLAVVFDGSELSVRALRIAASLLQSEEHSLVVLISAEGVAPARELQAQAAALLREVGVRASFRWLLSMNISRWKEVVEGEACGGLVLPAGVETGLGRDDVIELLNSVNCPVLLVR